MPENPNRIYSSKEITFHFFLAALILPPMRFALLWELGFFLQETLVTILVFFFSTGVVYGALYLWLKDRGRAYLLTLGIAVLFFILPSFALNPLVEVVRLPLYTSNLIIVLLAPCIFAALFFLTKSSYENVKAVYSALRLLIYIYVVIPLVLIGYALATYEPFDITKNAVPFTIPGTAHAFSKENLPDIYYIVPDMYASFAYLRNEYGFANDDLLSELKKHDFFVEENALSQYPKTYHSIAGVLNLVPFQSLFSALPSENIEAPLKYSHIHNPVLTILEKAGYERIQASATIMDLGIQKKSFADITPEGEALSYKGFLTTVLYSSILPNFYTALGGNYNRFSPFRNIVDITLDTFNILNDEAKRTSENPRFIFAHIFPPHNPPVFDKHGNLIKQTKPFDNLCCPEPHTYVVDGKEVQWRIDRNAYIEQIQYINGRLLELIDNIKNNATRPYVILLQADHGPNSILDWDNPSDEGLRERFSILNAVYFSDGDYSIIQTELQGHLPQMNSFRVIFNKYFGYDFPMLEPRSYFVTYDKPYHFRDVTDILKNPPSSTDTPQK